MAETIHPLLLDAARAAHDAFDRALATMSRQQRSELVGLGGDGTPTYLLDEVVEAPVLEVFERHGVNVLSEEIGWIDRGSAITVVVDPVDGTANAAAGVPLSAFAAAIAIDDRLVEAYVTWLGTPRTWWAHVDRPGPVTVTRRRELPGASVSLLRPRPTTLAAWVRVASRAERIRVLGSSVLEACLVADGAIDAFCDPGGEVHRIVDLAATSLIVRAAGGVMVDLYGRPFTLEPDLGRRWSGIAAASPQLAEEIAVVVRG